MDPRRHYLYNLNLKCAFWLKITSAKEEKSLQKKSIQWD
jgi:hypothetical protein